MALRIACWFVAGAVGLVALTCQTACNKSSSSGSGSEFFVVLGPPDMNGDGTVNAGGLERIKQASNQSNLTIRISGHETLSDAGLAQLAQFSNLHKVLAPNSRITPAGIDKLKKALPNVQVEK